MLYPLAFVVTLAVAGVVWYYATLYTPGAAQEGHLALTGATVLVGPDLESRDDTTVLIRDGRIVDVGRAGDVEIPAGATTFDLRGSTLLPGLIDLHVHLGSPERQRGEYVGVTRMPGMVLDAMRFVPDTRRALLGRGVTTVRSLGDDHGWVMEFRRLLRDGEIEGPRLYAAGPLFTTPGGHPVVTIGVEPESDAVRLPSTPEEARSAVRELAGGDRSVDLIKVVQERGRPQNPLQPIPADVLRAIVAEAHDHGLPVTAHWGTLEDLDDVLAADVDGLEHLEPRAELDEWPDGLVDALARRDIPVTPTLAVTEVALPPEVHRRLRRQVGQLHAAGVRIVAGSDAGVPGVAFGVGMHRELELLVASGLTPRDALQAATSEAAEVLRRDDIGVIAPGRAADLVVIDGDPLQDIQAIRNVVMVFRDGRLAVNGRS